MSDFDPLTDVPVRDLGPTGQILVRLASWPNVIGKLGTLAALIYEGSLRSDRWGAPARALVVAQGTEGLAAIRKIHAFVRDSVAYEDEEEERLESAAFVLLEMKADCDGTAVVIGTMVLSVGGSVGLIPLGGEPGDPAHVGVLVRSGGARVDVFPWQPFEKCEAPPGWLWAEATVAAKLGENPIKAAKRTGERAQRADLQRV